LGGKEGHGATCSFVIQSGKITSASLKTPGVNYTDAGIVAAFDPAAQTDQTVGYTNQSGGRMTSIVITNGGAGFSSQTKCVVVGGGGFGIDAAIYAAAMITGVPNVEGLESLLIVGDSIARGYGSTDARGDASGNYGIFERAVGSRYATVSTAIPGNAATAYKNPASHARMHSIVLPYVTHAIINLGTNDITAGATAAQVASANVATATELRRAGIKVSLATLLPRVSGTYTTLAGQTPVPGFTAGAATDTYNAWVRSGTNGLVSDWGFVDARTVYRDSTSQNKWRVGPALTTDGIHPSLAAGIPFGATQLAGRFANLAPIGSDYASATKIDSYASNTTINLAPAVETVTLHGTNVTINGGAASYTLSAPAGGNTVNAGAGESTMNVGGVYTRINVGSGNVRINDEGTYNVVKLAEPGSGVAVITGNIFQKGSRLDLRTLLARTSWNGSSTSLNQYLKIWISEGNAFLLVSPTGAGGKNFVAARLTSYDSLAFTTLLNHSIY
jgi:lysophospholipase L1-like esterase